MPEQKSINILGASIFGSEAFKKKNSEALNDISHAISLFKDIQMENLKFPVRIFDEQLSKSFKTNFKIPDVNILKGLKLNIDVSNNEYFINLINFNLEKFRLSDEVNPKYSELLRAGELVEYYSQTMTDTNGTMDEESIIGVKDTLFEANSPQEKAVSIRPADIQNISVYIKFLLSLIIYFSLLLPFLETIDFEEFIDDLPNYEINYIPGLESLQLYIGGLILFEKNNPIITLVIKLILIQIKKELSENHNLIIPNILEAEKLISKVIEHLSVENSSDKEIIRQICISNLCVITKRNTKIKSRDNAKSSLVCIAQKNQFVAINKKNRKWTEIFYFNDDKLANGWIHSKYLKKYSSI